MVQWKEKMEGQRPNEVEGWLQGLSLGHLYPLFEKEGIDTLSVLKALSDEELIKLGITKLGERKKIALADVGDPKSTLSKRKTKKINQGVVSRPYENATRCAYCCLWKVSGADLQPHSCRLNLYNKDTEERHSFKNCPTQNVNAHPDERKR